MAYKSEVYKDNAGAFRFRFKASNGENMFASIDGSQHLSAAESRSRGHEQHVSLALGQLFVAVKSPKKVVIIHVNAFLKTFLPH